MSTAPPSLGFDVGGQSIKAALVSPAGDVLAQATAPTGEETNADGLGDAIATLRERLLAEGKAPEAGGVGVGMAGALDRSGTLRGAPHLPRLIGVGVTATLASRLGVPVVVHNDADCAAMAEGWGGAADGEADFLLITIGTGVGSGLVLGGRLRAGASGHGCELGHMMVEVGGRRCGCGNRGCLEAYISETAAARQVEEAPAGLRARVAEHRAGQGGGHAQALFELGEAGDAEAEAIAGRMVDVLGAGIASMVNVVDLTTIVIGGGIAPGVLSRAERLRAAAAANLFARPVEALKLVPASRGPLAGAIGAARLGMLADEERRSRR